MKEGAKSKALMEARWQKILGKLKSNEEHLWKQGTISSHLTQGRRIWSVRFVVNNSGRRVHRAIYIGGDDPELLSRIRRFLDQVRQPESWPKEIESFVRWSMILKVAVGQRAGKKLSSKHLAME